MTKSYSAYAIYQTGTTDQQKIVDLIERETGIYLEDSSDIEYGDYWDYHRYLTPSIHMKVVDNVLHDEGDIYLPRFKGYSLDTVLVTIGVEDINNPVFRFLLSRPDIFRPVDTVSIFTDIEGKSVEVWEGYPPIPSEYLD
ncbi:hypothetical protein LC092_08815 [Stappia stellulata]|uniref:hypothetical protein n=1 Tax=Stappia stellulata TaxID=71235 RepID=UPI001CD38A35|nr:hypothetical protein [Stappia stellulata]MCA1242537.1 hypothetical protein [Stappia stellulata]